MQISRLIFIYKAWGECVKLTFGQKNWFSPKDCNFFGKIHFDQKYFFKIYFNLECNFLLLSKL